MPAITPGGLRVCPPYPYPLPAADPPAPLPSVRAPAPSLLLSSTPALPTTATPSALRARRVRAELIFSSIFLSSTPPSLHSSTPIRLSFPGPRGSTHSSPWMSLLCYGVVSLLALPPFRKPQGDVTGLPGCLRGLVPEWPVLHTSEDTAHLLFHGCPPHALGLHPHSKPSVSHTCTNHARSLPFSSMDPISTSTSPSTKRGPSRRAS